MIASLGEAAELLANMKRDGVELDPQGDTGNDYAYLVTSDPEIARKYGMSEESELWDDGGNMPDE